MATKLKHGIIRFEAIYNPEGKAFDELVVQAVSRIVTSGGLEAIANGKGAREKEAKGKGSIAPKQAIVAVKHKEVSYV